MNGIYNARSINDIYNIIKVNYNFNIADFKIKKVPVSIFDNFSEELLTSSNKYLNYDFAHKYMMTCKNCAQRTSSCTLGVLDILFAPSFECILPSPILP
jgi:hypothetical protein